MGRGDRRGRESRSGGSPAGLDPGESTLESFVARLHDEGVEAGRQEAERLLLEAREEAERIVERARRDAERIAAEARERAERDLARGRAELELAARDAVLELTEALKAGLEAILVHAVELELSDPVFLRDLLTEVVRSYARADAGGTLPVEVRIPSRFEADLEGWALGALADGLSSGNGLLLSPTLEETGFEYRVADGTVEVSVPAAVELLLHLLTPRLRAVVEEAARDAG